MSERTILKDGLWLEQQLHALLDDIALWSQRIDDQRAHDQYDYALAYRAMQIAAELKDRAELAFSHPPGEKGGSDLK